MHIEWCWQLGSILLAQTVLQIGGSGMPATVMASNKEGAGAQRARACCALGARSRCASSAMAGTLAMNAFTEVPSCRPLALAASLITEEACAAEGSVGVILKQAYKHILGAPALQACHFVTPEIGIRLIANPMFTEVTCVK
jgi:hypothetical protein